MIRIGIRPLKIIFFLALRPKRFGRAVMLLRGRERADSIE